MTKLKRESILRSAGELQMCINWEAFIGPFGGVLIAFAIARAYDWLKNWRDKGKLLQSLNRELQDCTGKLTGKGNLIPIDMWQSAIASGKVMLLSSEQQEKLGRIYHALDNHIWDSKKLWNVGVIAKTQRDGRVNTPAKRMYAPLTLEHVKTEKSLKASVDNLLEEKWWKDP